MKTWWQNLDQELGPTWDEIVELARRKLASMTPLERAAMHERQRLDFAYGNTKLANPRITRDMVQDAADLSDRVVRSTT